jgi:hypothetical protein
MKHITEDHMLGMLTELQKEAGGAADLLGRGVKGLRSFPLLKSLPGLETRSGQMLAGGAVGAGIGAATGEDGNRLHRGVLGGLAGASAVGLGHLATKGGREAAGKGVSNFWERQKYQFTGKGIEGTHPERVARAREIGVLPKLEADATPGQLAQDTHMQEALKNDWLSLPGSVHGLVTKPGTVLKNSWNRMDGAGKALTGVAGLSAASDLLSKPDPNGPGRLEKTLGNASGTLGFTAGPAGMLPGMLMGSWTGRAGQRVGRVGDRLTGHNPAPAEAYAPAYEGEA